MTIPGSRTGAHYVAAVVWLILTVSMASWWLSVGLTLENRHRMFVWEGGTFIVLLVAGGLTIVLAIRREHRRRQALETFFMSFTHDLKTSLASVQLQAEGLREDWPAAATRQPLDRLLHDTVRLQIQLENSLFVSQPDGRLLRERIDVTRTFERLAQDWPDLTLQIHGRADVMADARAFDAVCRNLLQNAVVHGAATGVDITLQPAEPERTHVTVRDNGGGVPAAALATLGEPFARGNSADGSGVGLFVCRQLMTRMGGAMTFLPPADGASGLGVRLTFPEDDNVARVLLVEDDASLGRTLEERLVKEKLSVTWTQTVAAAERALASGRWDLAIVDVKLPDGSGFGLARRIKRESLTPVMFMTALNSAENRLEGFEIGADEYLPKPFHLKEFILRVRHVLTTQRVPAALRVQGRDIDLAALSVVAPDGERSFLQVRDGRVLKLLIAASPAVVDRSDIVDRVWGHEQLPTPRAVDNAIVRLRQALQDEDGALIRSVRGIGYQWAPEDRDG